MQYALQGEIKFRKARKILQKKRILRLPPNLYSVREKKIQVNRLKDRDHTRTKHLNCFREINIKKRAARKLPQLPNASDYSGDNFLNMGFIKRMGYSHRCILPKTADNHYVFIAVIPADEWIKQKASFFDVSWLLNKLFLSAEISSRRSLAPITISTLHRTIGIRLKRNLCVRAAFGALCRIHRSCKSAVCLLFFHDSSIIIFQ